MRASPIAAALFLTVQGMVVSPSVAQSTSETDRLLKVIKAQQRRLDAQEAALAEQKKALQALRKEVEALHDSRPPATSPQTTSTRPMTAPMAPAGASRTAAAAKAASAGKTPARPAYDGLHTALTAAQEGWPGSFGLLGTDTRMKISGFVELDAIYDTDAIGTPTAFVTSAIVTGGATAAEGADGQTNFGVQPSRLAVETRTPLDGRQIKTFTSVDWFGDFTTTTPNIRLREAYGEVSDTLFGGDLLFGQTWTTYTSLYAMPNVLDFEGPNAIFGVRHPMVRWTKGIGSGLTLKLAAEAPDHRSFEGASPVSSWPDGAVALGWENDAANLQGNLLARDLRASDGTATATATVDTFGWGASIQGRIHMPGAHEQDFASISLTYGEGIGGVLNDAPPDASYDPASGELKAIPTLAWFGGYQHWWSPKLYSVISYGQVRQSNLDFQDPTAFEKTQYSSANLTWTPNPQWLVGAEILYGTRQDKDGADGSDVRAQFTSRFNF